MLALHCALAAALLAARHAAAAEYVFPAFTSASESNMFVYTSSDATEFTLLKGPAYAPDQTLIRDPSIIRHTDGLYYIAHTTNWGGRDFAIIRSHDLVSWTPHATIAIDDDRVRRTWAPEFFRDGATGLLHIVVSLGPDDAMQPFLFTATSDSMKDWSGPAPMEGIGPNYIDTFVVQKDGEYHAFTKNEDDGQKHIEHAVARRIEGPYRFVQRGDFAGWGQAEGPSVTTLEDGTYRLYADGYPVDASGGRYIYSDSRDLFSWSEYKTLPNGLSGFVRHGTVLRLDDRGFEGGFFDTESDA